VKIKSHRIATRVLTVGNLEDFLEIRAQKIDVSPTLIGLCAGYEAGSWRAQQLVSHMMEWLPDFALTYEERRSFGTQNAVRRMRKAAHTIYKTEKFAKRGEFGELLLHIAIRQIFNTVPAISKIYYKDSSNDTVKGFDAVHVVVSEGSLELWLGEAKFYDNVTQSRNRNTTRRHTGGRRICSSVGLNSLTVNQN
jgi:hypothetical protein